MAVIIIPYSVVKDFFVFFFSLKKIYGQEGIMGTNRVFMAWIKRPSLAHSTAINQHRVCVVSSLIQSLVSGCLYVECHKHQSYFSVYYFSHPPQIMLQEIDGNWINCCVYFKPGLVAGRTDLLDDRFDFFLSCLCPWSTALQTKAEQALQGWVSRLLSGGYVAMLIFRRSLRGSLMASLAERVSGISFLVFHA